MKKILAFALALAMILTCSLALADRLDDIKAAGKLTVATSPDWPPYEYIDDDGNIKLEYLNAKGETVSGQVYIAKSATGIVPDYKNGDTYSNNYLQVTLDAAAALRRGDIDYANACIDRIVSSSENLLVEIADLGNSEEYIEFNQTRFENAQSQGAPERPRSHQSRERDNADEDLRGDLQRLPADVIKHSP